MLESEYQRMVKRIIKNKLPGCLVLKTDPNYIQGIPDLLILYKQKWVALEVKRSKKAHVQPNQEFYVRELNAMSRAFFIYPENENEVIKKIVEYLLAF